MVETIYHNLIGDDGFDMEWIIIYDFPKQVSHVFFDNLDLVKEICGDGVTAETGVFVTCNWKAAFAVAELVKRYGGMYKVLNVEDPTIYY